MRKCVSFLHLRTFHFFSTPIYRNLINYIKHRMREVRGGRGGKGRLKQNDSHYNVFFLLYLSHSCVHITIFNICILCH